MPVTRSFWFDKVSGVMLEREGETESDVTSKAEDPNTAH